MFAFLLLLSLVLGCSRPTSRAPTPPSRPSVAPVARVRPGWLKGQTHVHSDRSGDSHTDPAVVVRWYSEHHYDFIVFTDHNVVTRPPPSPRADMLVLPGAELTWNEPECGPPESPCNLHVNALFVNAPSSDQSLTIQPSDPAARASVYAAEITQAESLGGIAQLNHPNFRYGANAALITDFARRGLRLVEFSNASTGCQNEGDATHPDTEKLWNQVLSSHVDVWNVASDDAHHYDDATERMARGEEVYVGDRGWVMVRAERTPEALRAAMMRGEFYATTGVLIDDIEVSAEAITVTSSGANNTTTFIVEPGTTLRTVTGPRATLPLSALGAGVGWVRATVDDGHGHRAWVQPLRVTHEDRSARVRGPFA